jgi:uncharacterized membrane protein YbaN (DUF454 family)
MSTLLAICAIIGFFLLALAAIMRLASDFEDALWSFRYHQEYSRPSWDAYMKGAAIEMTRCASLIVLLIVGHIILATIILDAAAHFDFAYKS